MDRFRRQSRKVLVGILGGLVCIVGLILVPYPGPGWLVVFGGLAILATEFTFAERVLHFAREKYDGWTVWLKRQAIWVRISVLVLTGIVVLVTLWIINAYGILVNVFHLPWDWLTSPLFK